MKDDSLTASASLAALQARIADLEKQVATLQARLERSNLFFQRSIIGILIGDGHGMLLAANPRAISLLGYTQEKELVGCNIAQIIHPEDLARQPIATGTTAARTGKALTLERRYHCRDGSWLPVHVDFSVLDEQNNLFQVMFQDIRASKAAEAAKDAALERAQAGNRAKTAFLTNMSHEIRTPLNGVMGMLQLLLATPHTSEQDEYMTTAMDASGALLRLLSDILDIARLDNGTMAVSETIFEINEVLDPVIASFSHEAALKGLALDCRIAPETPGRLCGDPARLRQILYNLTANAIKYTTFGRVGLEVQPLRVPGASEADSLEFIIRDTGTGIPADLQNAVFDAFAQADPSITRRHGGIGLGLTLVRALTECMGGRIYLSSEEGHGTEVRVRLPLCRPPEVVPVAAASGPACLVGQRVLVVEDEAINRLTIRAMLQRLRCEVVLAENGRDALAQLSQADFDCVLMDMQMPIMDGLTATRRIRNGSAGVRNPDIPILALTAHALEENREAAREAGVSGYVVKPVDMDALAQAMQAVVPSCQS